MNEAKLGIYKHYKGNLYEVLSFAKHSETEELMVVYKAMYGKFDIWVRPYEMFFEKITINEVSKPRFTYMDKNE